MNEKLTYATMLEIPVNTCSITYKQPKKRRGKRSRKVNAEAVKEELLTKINSEQEQAQDFLETQPQDQVTEEAFNQEQPMNDYTSEVLGEEQSQRELAVFEEQNTVEVHPVKVKRRGRFKFSVIGVQLTIIGALIATIFLTNALYADSGINVFLRGVFGTTEQTQVDERQFDDFSPVLAVGDDSAISLSEGVMTFSGEGSVYSPCDGKITAITQDEVGKFTIEITHSVNFKSVLSGIDYAYAGLNDKVFGNIPVGYVNSGATMCFKSGDGAIISNYQIIDDAVVWAV